MCIIIFRMPTCQWSICPSAELQNDLLDKGDIFVMIDIALYNISVVIIIEHIFVINIKVVQDRSSESFKIFIAFATLVIKN